MTDLKKQLLAGVLALTMVFSFAGCGDDSDTNDDDAPNVGS